GRSCLLSRPRAVRPGHVELRRYRSASPRNHDRRGHRGRYGLLDDRGPQRWRLARAAAPANAPAAIAVAFNCVVSPATITAVMTIFAVIARSQRVAMTGMIAGVFIPNLLGSTPSHEPDRTFHRVELGVRGRIAVRDLSRARSEIGRAIL